MQFSPPKVISRTSIQLWVGRLGHQVWNRWSRQVHACTHQVSLFSHPAGGNNLFIAGFEEFRGGAGAQKQPAKAPLSLCMRTRRHS